MKSIFSPAAPHSLTLSSRRVRSAGVSRSFQCIHNRTPTHRRSASSINFGIQSVVFQPSSTKEYSQPCAAA